MSALTAERPPDAVVDRIAELLYDEIGLRPESSLRGRLARCVREGAAGLGLHSDAYVAALLRREVALSSLIDEITVQESGFFRHPEQFDILARHILPTLTQPVTVWSAGCANGQEAFSLAMLLDEHRVTGTVVAKDLSAAAVRRTARARYTTREIGGISAERRDRYLSVAGNGWEVDEALRHRVQPARHNLIDAIPALARPSQVVFCRNILIYLSVEHTRAFLDRLADTFAPGTALFLGAAEVLWQVSERFEPVQVDNTYLYRCRGPRGVTAPVAPLIEMGSSRPPRPEPLRPVVRVSAPAASHPQPVAALALARTRSPRVTTRRRWSHFAPARISVRHDATAHLHLGLALEAAGDLPSARRAFGVARRTLLATDPGQVELASEGFSAAELDRLLATKEMGQP